VCVDAAIAGGGLAAIAFRGARSVDVCDPFEKIAGAALDLCGKKKKKKEMTRQLRERMKLKLTELV
jgi:uncharacterized membrane protein YqiK